MHRFRSILFSPLAERGNPAAARRIIDLAARNGAELTAFAAIPEPSRLQRLLHRPGYLETVHAAEGERVVNRIARSFPRGIDTAVATKTATGNPSQRIIEEVLAAGHDLVVVTTDEDDEDQATINRLLRKCPCPVWVIRPTRARIQRVMAAINPEPSEKVVNRIVVELAASMVRLYGGELHLLHAWELYGEATMRQSAFLHTTTEELEQLLREEYDGRRQALDGLLSDVGLEDQPWQIHLEKGRPSAVIADVVKKRRVNVLVMGTVARTGIAGLLIGNTAESVLDNVRCSVIAVKPPGFVSPIGPSQH